MKKVLSIIFILAISLNVFAQVDYDKEIKTQEEKIAKIETDITAIEAKIKASKEKIKTTEEKIDKLKTDKKEIENSIKKLEQEIETLKSK